MQYDIMPSGMRIFQYMLPGENYGGKCRMSSKFNTDPTAKSERISRLVENLYRKMPEIEPDRAVPVSYTHLDVYKRQPGNWPMVFPL